MIVAGKHRLRTHVRMYMLIGQVSKEEAVHLARIYPKRCSNSHTRECPPSKYSISIKAKTGKWHCRDACWQCALRWLRKQRLDSKGERTRRGAGPLNGNAGVVATQDSGGFRKEKQIPGGVLCP